MLALEWLDNTRAVMSAIEQTQQDNIKAAARVMADAIEAGCWMHTFGCSHATIPVEEMYPRTGGFVGFHPMVELPMTFFTGITGQMGIQQFLFLERAEGHGAAIMKGYAFDPLDTMWSFSHTGVNAVNIDVALEAQKRRMTVGVCGSAAAAAGKVTRHSCGKTIFDLADIVIDTCVPAVDASVELKNHFDRIGPLSTMAFVTTVWMTIAGICPAPAMSHAPWRIRPSTMMPAPIPVPTVR